MPSQHESKTKDASRATAAGQLAPALRMATRCRIDEAKLAAAVRELRTRRRSLSDPWMSGPARG